MQFMNLNHKRFKVFQYTVNWAETHFFVGQCFSGENNTKEFFNLKKLIYNFVYLSNYN